VPSCVRPRSRGAAPVLHACNPAHAYRKLRASDAAALVPARTPPHLACLRPHHMFHLRRTQLALPHHSHSLPAPPPRACAHTVCLRARPHACRL
jgi:hypothetical protein